LDDFVAFLKKNHDNIASDALLHAVNAFKHTIASGPPLALLNHSKKERARVKRTPNPYNIFMSTKMKELKASHNDLDNRSLMSLASKAYKEQKANATDPVSNASNVPATLGQGATDAFDNQDAIDTDLMEALDAGYSPLTEFI
jgi:hypothetical protein